MAGIRVIGTLAGRRQARNPQCPPARSGSLGAARNFPGVPPKRHRHAPEPCPHGGDDAHRDRSDPLRTSTGRLALLSLLATGLLGGACVPEGEEESEGQALAPPIKYDKVAVGHGIEREIRKRCAYPCIKWEKRKLPAGSRPGHKGDLDLAEEVDVCVAHSPNVDCSTIWGASLFADGNAPEPFDAYYEGDTWKYHGCGPQAAMNVLSYFGAYLPIQRVFSHSDTIDFGKTLVTDNIGQLPDDLAHDLQKMLNKFGDGSFVVRRHSNVSMHGVIRDNIDRGMPVIALVNNGNHFQVITGYEYTGYEFFVHVVDYAGKALSERWKKIGDIDFTPPVPGPGGWSDHTVVTIERY